MLTPPEMPPPSKGFKALYLEEQKMRNNLFWWLSFVFVKYKQAQLMTLEPQSLLFILTLLGEQQEAVLSLSVTGCARSCGFNTSARGDDRAQLPVEEEPEIKTNCFQARFHIKH